MGLNRDTPTSPARTDRNPNPVLDYERSKPFARTGRLRYALAIIAAVIIFPLTFFLVGVGIVEKLCPAEKNPGFMLLLVGDAIVSLCFTALSFLALIEKPQDLW